VQSPLFSAAKTCDWIGMTAPMAPTHARVIQRRSRLLISGLGHSSPNTKPTTPAS
jgi:hypothetical protein